MNKITTLFILLFPILAFSQQQYEPGYYIDKSGQKVSGFVANEYWYNTPTTVFFKKSLDQKSAIELTSSAASEIGIGSKLKFVSRSVAIDKLPTIGPIRADMSNSVPEWETKTIFLKALVEGNVSLFVNTAGDDSKFFFRSANDDKLYQLVYKKYYSTTGQTRENTQFRQQLFENVGCSDKQFMTYGAMKYKSEEFIALFEKVNKCSGKEAVVYTEAKRNIKVRFAPFLGYEMTAHKNKINEASFSKESSSSVMAGVEVAFVLPYRNERFEIYARAFYDKVDYTAKAQQNATGLTVNNYYLTNKYTRLSGEIGPRFNFNSNTKSRIYIDAGLGLAIPTSSTYSVTVVRTFNGVSDPAFTLPYERDNFYLNFNLEVGYVYNQKISAEARVAFFDNSDSAEGNTLKTNQTLIGFSLKYIIN
jgi:hypothetical protein